MQLRKSFDCPNAKKIGCSSNRANIAYSVITLQQAKEIPNSVAEWILQHEKKSEHDRGITYCPTVSLVNDVAAYIESVVGHICGIYHGRLPETQKANAVR